MHAAKLKFADSVAVQEEEEKTSRIKKEKLRIIEEKALVLKVLKIISLLESFYSKSRHPFCTTI